MKLFLGKSKKKVSIILALAMVLQMFIPVTMNYASANSGGNLGNIFRDPVLKVNEEEIGLESYIEIKDGMRVELAFNWEIENEVNVESGDYSEITIPPALKFLTNATGPLVGPDGEDVGTYALDGNRLKVVFNDSLKDKDDKKGFVKFGVEFNLEEFEYNSTQIIKFDDPINKEFTVTLKPQNVNTNISKFGKADSEINAKNIDWEIDINGMLDTIENAIVTDKIPEGLELNEDSIEVYKLIVGYTGKKTLGDKVDITPEITGDGFKVTLGGIKNAYRIKYSTKILDYSKSTFTNDAKLFNGDNELGDAKSTVDKVKQGSSIEKGGSPDKHTNPTKVSWIIDVNKSESEITNAKVSDELGQYLKPASNIRIFELKESGGSWNWGDDKTDYFRDTNNGGELKFPISLGDIDKAYRIVYDTEIEYPGIYQKQVVLKNTAILTGENINRGEATKEVTAVRDTLLEKTGAATVNYDTKEIKWTIHVNKANHNITNAVIEDKFGDGLKLKDGTFKIYGSDGKEVAPKDGFPKITENNGGFKIELGNINSYFKIEYITTITDYDKKNYSNNVSLKGGGIDGIVDLPIDKPVTIGNSYSKSTVASGKYDGIVYDGLNYDKKTMSWKVTIKPIKEKITALTITDTFPNNGMKLLPETLKVLKGNTLLEKDKDYAVVDNGHKGFILTFTGALPLEKSDYYVYYKTSFDPDIVKEAGGTLNEKSRYINKVVFSGKTKDANGTEKDINNEGQAYYDIKKDAYNSGKKEGTLRRDDREIDWKVYINYMSQNLGSFTVEDVMTDGQEFKEDTLVVKEYTVKPDGDIVEKDIALENGKDYTVNKTEKGFNVNFINGIEKSYVISYTSKITGISKNNYINTATMPSGRVYESTVTYDNHDDFLVKEGANVNGGRVYTDDVVNWKVTLNQSLSEIKNAVFTDTISSGLVYVDNSFKVYKGQGDNRQLIDTAQYRLEKTPLDNGDMKLKVSFNNEIKDVYTIEYDTVVIATEGKVKNSADFSGDEVKEVPTKTVEYSATQVSSGGGEGVNRGKIKVLKIDGYSKDKLNAEFELYYILNGEKKLVSDGRKSTVNGELEFIRLPYRTYYLKEITAPDGYQLNSDEIEIELNKEVKLVEKTIENYKLGSIKIVKVDSSNETKVLPGAVFEVIDSKGEVVSTLTTGDDGTAKIDNLPFGEYKVVEKKAPEGYRLDSTEHVVKIDKDNSHSTIELKLKNDEIPIIPWEPEEPKGSISIKKVDASDEAKALSGAVFEVRDSKGKVVATLTTGDDGTAKVDNLPLGEYNVVEIKSPVGYKLGGNEKNITIDKDGVLVELKFANEKEKPDKPTEPTEPKEPDKPVKPVDPKKPQKPNNPSYPDGIGGGDDDGELPKTGENSIAFYFGGLMLLALGLVLRKKRM